MSNKVSVKLIDNGKLPVYSSDLAAGCDFYALEGGVVKADEVIGLRYVLKEDAEIPLEVKKLCDTEGVSLINAFRDLNFPLEPYYDVVECAFNDHRAIKLTVKKHSIKVRTGVMMALKPDMELELRGRSGLGFKHEIIPFNGTIDADYRGEIVIKVFNHGNEPFSFEAGERIAQGVIKQIIQAEFELVEGDLPITKRGTGGLGSSGMK